MTVPRRAPPCRLLLIWAAVLACLALIVAALSVWAWWSFVGQYQPFAVTRDAGRVTRLLETAPWMSDGAAGPPLYVVGYRDSAAMRRFHETRSDDVAARGVAVRTLVFARPDRDGVTRSTAAERATVAELWLSRDSDLYQRWLATPARNWTAAGLPAAEADPGRAAALEDGRQTAALLERLLAHSRVPARYPLIVWRGADGVLKACACSEPSAWRLVIDDLPERPASPAPASPPLSSEPTGLPYPMLPPPTSARAPEVKDAPPPSPVVPTEPEPAPPPRVPTPPHRVLPEREAAPRPAAPRPRVETPSRPSPQPAQRPRTRDAPEAKRDEDSTFF